MGCFGSTQQGFSYGALVQGLVSQSTRSVPIRKEAPFSSDLLQALCPGPHVPTKRLCARPEGLSLMAPNLLTQDFQKNTNSDHAFQNIASPSLPTHLSMGPRTPSKPPPQASVLSPPPFSSTYRVSQNRQERSFEEDAELGQGAGCESVALDVIQVLRGT